MVRKIQTTLRLGNDVLDRKLNRVSAEGDELDVYNLFNLSNAKQVSISQYKQNYRIVGAYADLTVGYNNFLYLNITAETTGHLRLKQITVHSSILLQV